MKQRQFIIKSKENYRYKVVYGIKLKKTKKKNKVYVGNVGIVIVDIYLPTN